MERSKPSPARPFTPSGRSNATIGYLLGELTEGETLQAANGLATVLSLALVTCALPVYNIEVHGEHVYQVGEFGLSVHNTRVFQAVDQAGNIIYVGITGNFAARQSQHALRFQITPIIQGLSRSDARAIEQRLIDTIGLGKTAEHY